MAITVETQSRISHLAGLLKDEALLYSDLLTLSREEREAVLDDATQALERITVQKQSILARIARAETQRQLWINNWARENGFTAGGVTLSKLIESLPAEQAKELVSARDSLMAQLQDLAELNARNGELVASALRIVNKRLDAYQRIAAGGYHPTGERAPRDSAIATLDLKA